MNVNPCLISLLSSKKNQTAYNYLTIVRKTQLKSKIFCINVIQMVFYVKNLLYICYSKMFLKFSNEKGVICILNPIIDFLMCRTDAYILQTFMWSYVNIFLSNIKLSWKIRRKKQVYISRSYRKDRQIIEVK